MVIPRQILNNVYLSAEYQIHSEKKKSDSARKTFVKVKCQTTYVILRHLDSETYRLAKFHYGTYFSIIRASRGQCK